MILAVMSFCFILSGCQKDLYDPNGGARTPIITGIPDNFDWKTTTSVDLNVNVDDQFNGQYYYLVEVFDNNPVISNEAILLSKGVAKKGEPFNTSFSVSKMVKSVAIRQTSPTGISIVRVFDIVNQKVNCDFANTTITSRAAKRTLNNITTKSITFNNADFPTTIPTGTPIFSDTPAPVSGNSYVIPNGFDGYINLQGIPNVTLYVTGKVHLTSLYLTPGSKFYTLPNATVNTDKNDLGKAGVVISINTGATLNTTTLSPSSNIKVLNKGTINADVIQMTEKTVLYSTGTIVTKGKFSGENVDTQIINEGTITASDYELAGDSKMDNYGNVTIANKTYISSTGAVWRHFSGIFTTKTMEIQAQNENSVNGCQLIVTDYFNLHDAKLRIDAGAYVSCNSFAMLNARIEMGAKSILNISGTATYDYNTGNNGIYGTGTDYALYKANKVIAVNLGQRDIMYYGGKVQVECQDHVADKIDQWNLRFKQDNTVHWVKKGETSISIDKSDCTPGNNPKNGTDPTNPTFPIEVPKGTSYTYAMEDSWPDYGDYDMNDLVLNAAYGYQSDATNKVTTMTIKATLRAIGAFKRLGGAIQLDNVNAANITNVSYDVKSTDGSVFNVSNAKVENGQAKAVIPIFDDAHQFISNGSITNGGNFVNTVIGQTKYPEKTVTITITFAKSKISQADIDVKNLNFFLVTDRKSTNRTEIHLPGYKGTDKVNKALFNTGVDNSNAGVAYRSKDNLAWGLMIPGTFNYPVELTDIKKVYPDFAEWAINAGTKNQTWYNTPVKEYIYK